MIKNTINTINTISTFERYSLNGGVISDLVREDMSLTDLETVLVNLEGVLKKIDLTNRGFINSTDIFDNNHFPIISDNLSEFIRKGKNKDKDKEKILSLDTKKELFKWVYNLILLDMYVILTKCLLTTNQLSEENENARDLNSDYNQFYREISAKLDPTIRSKIKKRGVVITQNIYNGYDTEYKMNDLKSNKLLSVQLAVNTKLVLKIPLNNPFCIGALNTLTGTFYKTREDSGIDTGKILTMINDRINIIRNLRFSSNDLSLNKIIDGLKSQEIPYILKDECIHFSFDRTPIKKWIHFTGEKGFSLVELVKSSNSLVANDLENDYDNLINRLKNIYENVSSATVNLENVSSPTVKLENVTSLGGNLNNIQDIRLLNKEEVKKDLYNLIPDKESTGIKNKRFTRTNLTKFSEDKVSVTKVKNSYIIGHLTSADLSILNDFDSFKEELSILNKCFITMGKGINMEGVNVIIRDTMLLAPGNKKSLASIGNLYGEEFNKIRISKKNIENMDEYQKEDIEGFKEYALQDSLITLIHASFMEDFNLRVGGLGIPLSLSSLGSKNLYSFWSKEGYKGYQISSQYLLGNVADSATPKGLNALSLTGLKLNYYIANYKGGRNESFMYGLDKETVWYDYDLISAYTTVMGLLGDPDYKKAQNLSNQEFLSMNERDILYSYTIIIGSFKFPESVKYPSIPCLTDETTTIYPLNGECILTGAEYLLAKSQQCDIIIKDIFTIPFKKYKTEALKKSEVTYPTPFKNCIIELQRLRGEHAKGTINNLLYKEMGNSIYGLITKGISNKKSFDIKSGLVKATSVNELANPIISSWITAFTRSVIGELLHEIQKLNGLIVSVTTDGFLTNVENLEDKLNGKGFSLFNEYKRIRFEMSGNKTGLELKKQGKGIISWNTRGQFSEDGILAGTGFQRGSLGFDDLNKLFINTMKSPEKSINFIQFSLRSALDVYKKGGHVTPVYSDKVFRMHYDNRRIIKAPKDFSFDFKEFILLDSKPVPDIHQSEFFRFVSKKTKTIVYQKNNPVQSRNVYRNVLDLGVRNFLKSLLNNELNLDKSVFKNYKDIIDYIKQYKSDYNLTVNNLSALKRRKITNRMVPQTRDTLAFVKYIKEKFPNFDDVNFFR